VSPADHTAKDTATATGGPASADAPPVDREDIDREDIDAIVRNALAEIAPEADLTTLDPEASVQDVLDLDSMDFLNFVTALHEATGVDIPERDYALIDTLSGATDYLVHHRRPSE
jgi:acyl carrier protein